MHKRLFFITVMALISAPVLAGCAETGDNGNGGGGDDQAIMTTCGNNALSGGGGGDDASAELADPRILTDPDAVIAEHSAMIQQTLGELKIGSIMPITGALADFGTDMRNGVELAVDQMNDAASAAEGVSIAEITHLPEDSKTSPTDAPSAMNKLVSEGVSAVVGAASSGVTSSVLGIAVQNEIVLVTPASTSPSLSDPEENQNNGFFFRVPPSDALQGQVLGDLVWLDGCKSAIVVAVNNPYGQGLARNFEEKFTSLGGDVQDAIYFDEQTASFSSEIESADQAGADAVVFIGYPGEGVPFVQQAYERGLLGASVLFFSEGVKSTDFVDNVGASILAGLGGTTPAGGETGTAEYRSTFEERFGNEPSLFSAESYDAAVGIMLAAVAAESTDGAAIKEEMRNIWNAPGVKVSDVQQALAAVAAGQDIDWAGPSGDFDWDEYGDPTSGVYSYWVVQEDGTIKAEGEYTVGG